MRLAPIAVLLLLSAAPLAAQDSTITIRFGSRQNSERLVVRELPRDVAVEAVRFFNAPGTVHFSGVTRIPAGRGIDGDVAILGGPVHVGGRISGSLLVVNGDVSFESGAVIGGDVTVIGGTVSNAADADIDGEIRSYRDPLRYRRFGDEIAYAPTREATRPMRTRRYDVDGSRSNFLVALGGTYNRVEGAPFHFGPRLDERLNDGMRLRLSLIGILRSGRDFSFDEGDFGYRTSGELLFGTRNGNLGLGARAYDIVQSTEPWPLKDYEAGWSAFLLHRDYRDYYRKHGAALYAALRPTPAFTLTAEGRDERHGGMDVRDPWTIFRSSESWRANPDISAGRYRALTGSLRLDTRNDRAEPSSGLFVTAEYEAGRGTEVTHPYGDYGCAAAPCPAAPGLADGNLDYQRIFLDARTYLRLSPAGRLNLRLAGGGWVGGDPLPIQNRMALGAPDPLPGYGFRDVTCGGDALPGAPGLCDRTLVAQAEFRTHFGFDFGPDWANGWGDEGSDYEPFHVSGPDVVVFADAGHGWITGSAPGQIAADKLPSLRTFRADIGLGLDFGPIGLYLARAVDAGEHPLTFSVRMGRRF